MKVVLDAMGGDHAPAAAIEGVLTAVGRETVTESEVVLVGQRASIVAALEQQGASAELFAIVDAPDELAGGESPVEALKKKPKNSIAVGLGLVKAGKADVFVSAGNTGLIVAAATLELRCLEGIRRPGIAVTIHGERGPFIIIDVGANPQPKALHLLHYAIMGSAYHRDTFGTGMPRVGLMNIGSEDRKGNALVRGAKDLISQNAATFEFVGNVEGVEVFSGACDVVVSDGFTGNVLLKVSEGIAEYMLRAISSLMQQEAVDEVARLRVLQQMRSNVDYSNYGGALLLGVEGIVTICHGRSKGTAFSNAIRFASRAVGSRVNEHTVYAARLATAAT